MKLAVLVLSYFLQETCRYGSGLYLLLVIQDVYFYYYLVCW
jgi:hypothetical protein